MIRSLTLATALATPLLAAAPALAEPESYTLDASHSQAVFNYEHQGFSTTYGMFSGFEGTIEFDADDPAASSVDVSIPLSAMFTGWEGRDQHLTSPDFLDAAANEVVGFKSTSIEVTGEDTANITGDLTLGGETKEVVLDAKLKQMGENAQANKPWVGFTATTTLLRSDFDAGKYAPFISDEVEVFISIEAGKTDA